MNEPSLPTRFVTDTDIDAVLIAGRYTLLDQNRRTHTLQRGQGPRGPGDCRRRLQLRHPSPASTPTPTCDYAAAPAEIVSRARRLQAVCDDFGVPLPAAAVQFVVRHQAVGTVLLGARSRAEGCGELVPRPHRSARRAVASARRDHPRGESCGIDAHHHLWDPSLRPQTWMDPKLAHQPPLRHRRPASRHRRHPGGSHHRGANRAQHRRDHRDAGGGRRRSAARRSGGLARPPRRHRTPTRSPCGLRQGRTPRRSPATKPSPSPTRHG